jgi:hypothetical protein
LIEGRAAIALVATVSEYGEVAKDLLAVDADRVRLPGRVPEPGPISVIDNGVGREA